MIRIEFKEYKPGFVQATFDKWKGGNQTEIAILHSQLQQYLGQDNQWQSEPVWHKLDELTADENGILGCVIGPNIIDPMMLEVGNVRYLIEMRDSSGFKDNGVPKMIGNILASVAEGSTIREDTIVDAVSVDSEPQPMPEPVQAVIEEMSVVEIEPEVKVEPVTTATAPQKSKKGLIAGIFALLLVLIGVGIWWFLTQNNAPAQPVACDIKSKDNDELSFIQLCLKTNPDTASILKLIDEAKETKQCSVAQRLYANKANSGDSQIALAYAQEYDPDLTKGGCFETDKETAIYWYETVLVQEPNNAKAKERLDVLKK